jgi:hypothetical protein
VVGLIDVITHPAMFTLLFIGILIVVLASVVTVHAAVTAPEGYEDSLGFHVVSAPDDAVKAVGQADRELKAGEAELPPLAATR